MPQSTDILLDGAGYMLAPGKLAYRRTQDGIAEGRSGRVQIKDFFGGQRRPFQLERDKVFGGTKIGPLHNGQAVRPWPYSQVFTMPANWVNPDEVAPIPWCGIDDYIFFGGGGRIWRSVILSSGGWADPTIIKTQGGPVRGLCYYNGSIMSCMGPYEDIVVSTYPSAGSNTYLMAGEKGNTVVSYSGYAMWSDGRSGQPGNQVRMVTGVGIETRWLDSRVIGLITADAYVYAITRAGIYRFSGRVKNVMITNPAWTSGGTQPAQIPGQEWSGEWEPFFQHGNYTDTDDYRFLLGFGGRIYAWYAKRVMEFNPNGDRAGWRDTGLGGIKCFGACVSAGYLIVCIQNNRNRRQVWAWDGSGWWLVLDNPDGQYAWGWPIALNGAGNFDVMLFHLYSNQYTLLRLIDRSAASLHSYNQGSSSLITPLIDAGERDKNKAWRKIGCLFADPDPPVPFVTSADVVSVFLDYSVDNGNTWVQAATQVLTGNTYPNHQIQLDADIASASAVSRWLMLRVRWESVQDWAPALVNCWAEFEMLDSPARRRKWYLSVKAADQLINREGGQFSTTGRQLINQLWNDWQTGSTLSFRDIDYDDVATERNVRIVGIEEDTERPADSGSWGHSTVKLVLVEV